VKRSITACFMVCGAMFLVEFGMELAVQPNSSMSHLVGVMRAQVVDLDEEKPEDPRPERKLSHPSPDWILQLEKISTAIDDEDYDSAREMLDRQVQRTRRWNERELAIFHQRYLDLALSTEDFTLAIEQAGKILEYAEHVSYFTEERVLWMVATIYASDEYQDFEKALEYIQRWLDLKLNWEEGSRNYAFIGGIYAHLEDYYKVEEWMTRAIERAEEEEIEIPDYWRVQLWQAYRQLAEELKDSPAERDSYLEKAQELAQFFEMMPVFKPEPEYPIDALQQGIEGYVIVQFNVTEEGTVENPVVLESKPADTFDSSAIRAASKFKYKPKIVNDQAVRVDGVKHRIQYKIE